MGLRIDVVATCGHLVSIVVGILQVPAGLRRSDSRTDLFPALPPRCYCLQVIGVEPRAHIVRSIIARACVLILCVPQVDGVGLRRSVPGCHGGCLCSLGVAAVGKRNSFIGGVLHLAAARRAHVVESLAWLVYRHHWWKAGEHACVMQGSLGRAMGHDKNA